MYLSFLSCLLFFFIFFLLFLAQPIQASKFYSLWFQNDFKILENYEIMKRHSWWFFTIDNYREDNQVYGNIFSYYELPANSEWSIVPLKGPGRIALKAPLLLFTGSDFFTFYWKILWVFLCWGFFLILFKAKHTAEKALLLLSLLTFSSYLIFDFEFLSLFLCIIFWYLFFLREKWPYLFYYFILWLYAAVMRTEFFLFFSVFNCWIVFYALKIKRFTYIFYVIICSLFFLGTYMLMNKQYYGWYFITWYEVQREISNFWLGINSDLSFFDGFLKIFWYFFPLGFNLTQSFWNFIYVINSVLGVGLILLLRLKNHDQKSKTKFYLHIFILVLVFYWVIFYASSPYFYRPDVPTFSSYTRYLWVFVLVLWAILYKNFISSAKIVRILYSVCTLLYMFLGIHFFGQVNNDLNSASYIKNLESKIPSWSVVLPTRPVRFILSDYRILQPSGSDTEEYIVFLTLWRTARPSSSFLEKVGRYVEGTNNPIYIVGEWFAYNKIVEFFKLRWYKVVTDSNGITLLTTF